VAAARTLEIVKVNGWPPDWADRLVESWSRYGSVSHGQLGRALKPLQAAHAFDDVQRGLEAWLAAGKGSYGVYSFVRDAVRWINGDGAAKSNSATATTSRALSALLGGRR
jgi:S1-C subfamily serine protease